MDFDLRLVTSTGRETLTVSSSQVKLPAAVYDENIESCTLFISSWVALLSDSPVQTSHKPIKIFRKFYHELCEDLKGTVIRLSDLSHTLVSQHSLMGHGTSIGPWIDAFRDTPVFFEYVNYFKTGDPSILSYLYTFLNFGKKLEFVDEEFSNAAFRSWMDIETRLADQQLDKSDVDNIRAIISRVLPFPSDAALWPKHGPGAVSERIGRSANSKHSTIAFDSLIDRYLLHGFIGKYGQAGDLGFTPYKVIPDPSTWTPDKMRPRIPAKLRFVPKNLKTARSICMEPAVLMFFQQAVARWLSSVIETGPLGKFIRLKDQSRNRSLSEFGSYTGAIDTIDLSAASDSFSYSLAKQVFSPAWRICMEVTRSKVVELPDGSNFTIAKFAPMGSALCFPAQCILFAAVGIYASHLCRMDHQVGDVGIMSVQDVDDAIASFSDGVVQQRFEYAHFQPLAVYGDDICCDSRLTACVKLILSRLGFTVNDSKSFVGSQSFRESCGGYYLEGHDVTPLYYRVKTVRRTLTVGHIVSQVHLINECRARGFKRLYSFLIHVLREWRRPKKFGDFSIPFVPVGSLDFGIHSSSCANKHLKFRVNPELQRDEWRVWTLSYEVREPWSFSHDSYSLMRKWASLRASSTASHQEAQGHSATVGCRLKWIWTPLYSLDSVGPVVALA